MNFGERLKQIRANQGLSQEQLAEKIGVSRQAITKWETNRGLPDVENMIILAEIFKVTLDELILERMNTAEPQQEISYSETVYDIDCEKHFDIRIGNARKICIKGCDDEKVHIKLQSEVLENLSSLYKVKIDEKKKRLDIDCQNKKEISSFEVKESLDIIIMLPVNFTEHCEIDASVKELYIENLKMKCLEYDGDAESVYIKDTEGSIEFTGKTDYDIIIDGNCTQLDVNQWGAKTLVHVADINKYTLVNKGRKSKIYCLKDGTVSEEISDYNGENTISISGIGSELIVSSN
ncbi:MAG: helix-turn-helix transcriptional regulator [Oscillospiraceae bacterium]|nr:helix-turn-helix transcriptional regulator [Oscillospiraceae bacterium]